MRWLRRLLFIAALFALALQISWFTSHPLISSDAGWNLATARWVWQNGRLPDTDPLLFTTALDLPPLLESVEPALPDLRLDRPLRSHWVAQLVMYGFWSALGDAGLWAFRALAFLAILGLLWVVFMELELSVPWRLLGLLLTAHLLGPFVTARPALLSLGFILAVQIAWLRCRGAGDPGWGWTAVGLVLIWTQFHSGFIYGVAISLAWTIGLMGESFLGPGARARTKRSGISPHHLGCMTAVVAVVPLLVNPAGAASYLASLRYMFLFPKEYHPAEVQIPTLQAFPMFWVVVCLVVVTSPLVLRTRGLVWLFLLAGSALTGMSATRNVAFALLICVPLLLAVGQQLAERMRPESVLRSLRGALVLAVIVLVSASPELWRWPAVATWQNSFPSLLVAHVRAAPPPGRPYNTYSAGGYLTWQLPEHRWFIDGRNLRPRLDVMIYQWSRPVPAPGGPREVGQVLLDHYDVRWAVVFGYRPSAEQIFFAEDFLTFLRLPDWMPAAAGNGSFLFVRALPSSQDYLHDHQLSVAGYQRALLHLLNGGHLLPVSRPGLEVLGLVEIALAAGRFAELGPVELPDPARLLESLPPEHPLYGEARALLARWPSVALPYLEKLATMEGGERYRAVIAQLHESL